MSLSVEGTDWSLELESVLATLSVSVKWERERNGKKPCNTAPEFMITHVTSRQVPSHHLTSPHLTSTHPTLSLLTPFLVIPFLVIPFLVIPFHPISSQRIPSHRIASHPIPSYLTQFHLTSPHPTPLHFMSPSLVSSHQILWSTPDYININYPTLKQPAFPIVVHRIHCGLAGQQCSTFDVGSPFLKNCWACPAVPEDIWRNCCRNLTPFFRSLHYWSPHPYL